MRAPLLRLFSRLGRVLLWTVGGVAALVVVLVCAILVAANVGPGRRLIETEVASLTGGMVRVAGIGGRFPDALRVAEVRIDDGGGTWLTLRGLVLDWHPLALVSATISVDRLAADAIEVARLPIPAPAPAKPAPAKPGGGLRLPLALRLRALDVASIDVGAPVAGRALALSLHGHASIASLQPILAGPTPDTLPTGDVSLALADAAGKGRYGLDGDVTPGGLSLHLTAHEAPGGVIAAFAHSDQISPFALDLSLDGPRRATALHLALAAGKLVAGADGLVDLNERSARLAITAHAPAMRPVPGVAWQSVAIDAHLSGRLAAPEASGTVRIAGLAAGGATIGAIDGTLSGGNGGGSEGPVALHAAISGLRIPGPKPDLLASSPVLVDASAELDRPGRPATIHVSHPLLDLQANLDTAPEGDRRGIGGHVALRLPDLAPLASAGGVALAGSAALAGDVSSGATGPGSAAAALSGTLAITGGLSPVPALIGPDGRFTLAAAKQGPDLSLQRFTLDGAAIHAAASGTFQGGAPNGGAIPGAKIHLALPELRVLSPAVAGNLVLDATASGPTADLALTVHAAGDIGAHGVPPGPVTLDVAATHLPKAPDATVRLGGRLDGSPVTLAADVARSAAGATTIHLGTLAWKSLQGHGDATLPAAVPGATAAALPTANIVVAVGRLGDFSRLAGQALAGSLKASVATAGKTARIDVAGAGIAAAGASVGHLALDGTVADPTANPALDLRLAATGIAAGGAAGGLSADAHATARGTLDALALGLAVDAPDLKGAPARLSLASLLDTKKSTLTLRSLAADWHGEALRLEAPSRITYAPGVSVERLRLALGGAAISIDGRVTPTLALTASLHDLTPALAAPIVPTLKATGRADIDAHLTGTTARPGGRITVTASGLRLLTGPAASLPPARIAASATLAGRSASIDARASAGSLVTLAAGGTVPLGAGPLAMRANGAVDLAVLNPVLEQQGRHASGRLTLDAGATGSLAAPLLSGSVGLAHADIQDFAQGAHLSDIEAAIALAGQTVRIDRFTAAAGSGTLGVTGSVGVLAPGRPVDLHVTMNHASPVASDLLTAILDARVDVTGQLASAMKVAGKVTIDRADINIPNGLPSSVATLHVIRPGQKPPPPPAPGAPARVIALDLDLDAPGQIFVRGHGLDAVLGGSLHAGGTAKAPQISGGFELRRGDFSLAGTSLTFTKGTVGFNGTTNGHLDPTVDFVAESFVNQYTASLEVSGYASKPKITLSSNPPLPQDQVLALLLFGTDTKSLSPLQIAQIAAALASLSGGGGGFDPLATVRNTLGLDRLTVGSGTGNGSNTGSTIEGGKYVTRRVYVGARQSTAGGGTQALVQIDLTKRLKAFTTVGTGGTVTGATTPENDPGSSIGLKYQFRY